MKSKFLFSEAESLLKTNSSAGLLCRLRRSSLSKLLLLSLSLGLLLGFCLGLARTARAVDLDVTVIGGGSSTPTPSPSPTPTPTPTPSPSPTPTPTATATPTPSPTASPAPGVSPTPTLPPGAKPSPTPTSTVEKITNLVENVAETVQEVVRNVIETIMSPEFQEATKEVTRKMATPVATTAISIGTVSLATSMATGVGLSFWSLFFYPWYLFNLLLEFVGLRRKRKPWGIVYDAQSKAPVALAIVRIFNDKTRKLLETRVTDKEGRFGFLVPPGHYYLTVTKGGYTYASRMVTPGTSQDDVYANLYHGAVLAITSQKEVINVNIPIDPEKEKLPTWQENFKEKMINLRILVKKIIFPILVVSLILSFISFYYLKRWQDIAFSFFLILLILKEVKERLSQVSWGIVYHSQTKKPLKGVLVSIFDLEYRKLRERKTTDNSGRYGFFVPPGSYYLQVEKQGFLFPSQKIKTKNDPPYHHLYFGGIISKPKPEAFVSADIALDPEGEERQEKQEEEKKPEKPDTPVIGFEKWKE